MCVCVFVCVVRRITQAKATKRGRKRTSWRIRSLNDSREEGTGSGEGERDGGRRFRSVRYARMMDDVECVPRNWG